MLRHNSESVIEGESKVFKLSCDFKRGLIPTGAFDSDGRGLKIFFRPVEGVILINLNLADIFSVALDVLSTPFNDPRRTFDGSAFFFKNIRDAIDNASIPYDV